jgi:hypothetical protein
MQPSLAHLSLTLLFLWRFIADLQCRCWIISLHTSTALFHIHLHFVLSVLMCMRALSVSEAREHKRPIRSFTLFVLIVYMCACLWCVHALRNEFLTKNPPLFVFCNSDTCTSTRLKNLHPACLAICPCLSACKYAHTQITPGFPFVDLKISAFVCVINQLHGPVTLRRLFCFCIFALWWSAWWWSAAASLACTLIDFGSSLAALAICQSSSIPGFAASLNKSVRESWLRKWTDADPAAELN